MKKRNSHLIRKIRFFYYLFILILFLFLNFNIVTAQTDSQIFGDTEFQQEVGDLGISITNYGIIGSHSKSHPAMEYPAASGIEVLYQASLWVGAITSEGDTLVSCGEGNESTTCPEWHHIGIDTIKVKETDYALSSMGTFCQYSDVVKVQGHTPLGLKIIQYSYAWNHTPFTIIDFCITNLGIQGNLSDLFIGLMCDFDLPNSGKYWLDDMVDYLVEYELSYMFNGGDKSKNEFVGVRMLSHKPSVHLIWDWDNDPISDIDRYHRLSSNRFSNIPNKAYDYRFLQGVGPFNLSTGDSIRVAFAFLGASNLNALSGISVAALNQWENIILPNGRHLQKPLPKDLIETKIPTEYTMSQNYPNPFNQTTSIAYEIPELSYVKLFIYDINGKLIETLVNEKKNAGYYTAVWNAEKVSSGIYFYRIDAGEFSNVKKCLVVK